MHMNKYLTFLLVILTATGSEAQAIESAVAISKGGCIFEETLLPEQLCAIGKDFMSVLKILQHRADENISKNHFYNNSFQGRSGVAAMCYARHGGNHIWAQPRGKQLLFIESAISIRAPSYR